jgi:hypothetical protein
MDGESQAIVDGLNDRLVTDVQIGRVQRALARKLGLEPERVVPPARPHSQGGKAGCLAYVPPRGQKRSQNRWGDWIKISRSKSSMLAACGSSRRRANASATRKASATAAKKIV